MNINERKARAKAPQLFDQSKGQTVKKNPARKRTPAQRAATAKLVALNKARRAGRKGNPSATGRRITATPRNRAEYIESARRNPAPKPTRGLGYAVLSGAHVHSIWRMRPDAIAAGKSLANSIGSPVRVVAGAYTWAAD